MSLRHRAPGLLLTALIAAMGVHLFAASPALATMRHFPITSFAAPSPGLLAINQSTGHVYVPTAGGVENFEADGTLDATTPELTGTGFYYTYGVGVDNSAGATAGDIYVADLQTVKQFNPSGQFTGLSISSANIPSGDAGSEGGFEPTSPAVDASGNIYVSDYTSGVIDEFTSAGTFIRQIGAGQTSAPNQVAVDSSGHIYVVNNQGPEGLIEFDSSGACVNACASIDHSVQSSVAVDSANNLFGGSSGTVTEYGPSGSPQIEQFGAGTIANAWGIAVNSTGAGGVPANTVYVSDPPNGDIHVFELAEGQALTVTKTGTGSGSVTRSLQGIECSSTCTAEYNQGATVTLTAEPGLTSEFTGWSVEGHPGACPGTGTCEVEMSEAKTVKANFTAIPQKALKVEKTGTGSGTVTSSAPTGFTPLNCGSTCTATYNQGTEITLTATPNLTAALTGWSVEGHPGACPGTGTCEVEMSEAKTLVAEFTLKKQTLTVAPTGPGSVSANTGAISNCSSGGGACVGTYNETSMVTLTATPAAHNHVTWSGCSHAFANTCEVTLGLSVANVGATFSINRHTLTVAPTGPGAVNANEGTIAACAAHHLTCAGTYDETSTVTLTASPSAHSNFVGWSGCTHAAADTCEVEIGASDSGVSATFASNKQTLSVTPTGSGSISANSGTIRKCSSTGGFCSGEYIEASTLTLTASPIAGQGVIWSGCTHSSANTCEVTIGASAASVQATFAQITHALAITEAGTGAGTVSCDGGPCASRYNDATTLTFAATAAPGSTFSGWSGAGCSGTDSCKVTIAADTAITATFNAKPEELESPPSNRVTLGSVTQHGANLVLAITVPGPGILSASGKNLKTTTGSATGPGHLTLTLQMTSAGQKLLDHKGKLKLKVTVLFTPSGGSPGTAAKTITFKAHTEKMGGRHG